MYATTLQEITIPFLHDAVMVCQQRGYEFNSLYMDPSGECAVTFFDELNDDQVKEIIQNFLPYDVNKEDIYPIYNVDFGFIKLHTKDGKRMATKIYTPDDLDYRTLKIN